MYGLSSPKFLRLWRNIPHTISEMKLNYTKLYGKTKIHYFPQVIGIQRAYGTTKNHHCKIHLSE